MSFKNTFIKWLCAKKKPSQEPREKRFLIVSTTGLGDTLWGTPAIRALRKAYPHEYIAVLTSPIGYELLLHNPHINELFVLQNPPLLSLLKTYKQIAKRSISHALFFHTSRRFILPLISLSGPSTMIGTEGMHKGVDFLLTHPIPQRKEHEIDRRLRIVEAVGATPRSNELELFMTPQDAQVMLQGATPIIAMHPGANARFKCWPASHFISLAERLYKTLGCQVYITGSPEERPLVESIVNSLSHVQAKPLIHLPLRAFTAFLQRVDLFITNDTGPMHCAFAAHTPTLALFTPTDPALCGPREFRNNIHILQAKRTCSPCIGKRCQDPFCLLQIGVDEAYDAALQLYTHK